MIVTVTMNPAVDKTVETDTITVGGLNRVGNVILDAGGKGVNVSKMIAALGGESVATGFLGGSAGNDIESVLQGLKIKTDFVRIKHATRTNLKVFCKDSGITEFNEQGAAVTPDEIKALDEKLLGYASPGTIFVFSGSLPHGVEADAYRRLIELVREKGASVFLDADGPAFKLALSAKPDFIKPNKYELMQYFGEEGELTISELTALCGRLLDMGIGSVALSMGADGALFVSRGEVLHAPGLRVKALSTVGAGDSMVGALVYAFAGGLDFKSAAALAMAASAGAVMTEGTKPPNCETVDGLLKQVILNTH